MTGGEAGPLLGGAAPAAASKSYSIQLQVVGVLGLILVLLLGQAMFSGRRPDDTALSPVHLAAQQPCASAQPGALLQDSSPACKASTEYISSDLEQMWLKNAAEWEKNFCGNMAASDDSTKVWVEVMAEHAKIQEQYISPNTSPAEALAQQQKMDPKVFSRFVTTFDCGSGKTTQQTTWIEPLSHGLRHPNALCDRGADLMDRQYLLLAHKADHATATKLGNTKCQNRTCQAIYFDLGATTLQPTPQEAGQGWFYSAYKRQGITFDRFLLWEAVPRPPAEVFKNVPHTDMHKYQYFNIPVTTDTKDPSNPVVMLKTIAQPGDFVVFKLDIDNYGVEHAIMDAIKADPEAMALIDEFYFEEHVNFQPMVERGWAGSTGEGTSLASSYALFHSLRQQGLRAHSWV